MKSHWPTDIAEMHTKFGVRPTVATMDRERLLKFLEFRLNFLQEELDEAREAAAAFATGENRADDIVDAMVDLCVVAIGTLDAFQVDADLAWSRVHTANMQKEVGVKASRPNPLGLPDLIKPAGWTAPTHADNTGLLGNL
jgi:predicted HAD superfamily Cof-like phosphohydrolase